MGNVLIYAPLVNSSQATLFTADDSSEKIVESFFGDDTGARIRHVVIEITTASGKEVRVVIPNDHLEAVVYVDGDLV
ncbi:hypothetical protein [Massilia antarctica]|uniref:hypothetical protein n=1 Tax=Massilia antarctica TaxID=2765360 RepID=UPI00227060A1|nr:hypothetical protein [Massilia sp. H27-R4]